MNANTHNTTNARKRRFSTRITATVGVFVVAVSILGSASAMAGAVTTPLAIKAGAIGCPAALAALVAAKATTVATAGVAAPAVVAAATKVAAFCAGSGITAVFSPFSPF